MIYSINEIKTLIEPIAIEYNLPAVYLFGSYARGDATDNSDIDFLIDDNNSTLKSLFDIGGLFDDMMKVLSKKIDIVSINGLMSGTHKVDIMMRNEILNERVLIYDQKRLSGIDAH